MSSSELPAAAHPPTAPEPYVAPPPVGYPTKDGSGSGYSQNSPPPVETKSRGGEAVLHCCLHIFCCCCEQLCGSGSSNS